MASQAATEAVKATTRSQLRLIALPLCKKPELIYYYAHKRQIKGKQPESTEDSANSSTDVEAVNEPERGKLAGYVSKATSESIFKQSFSRLCTENPLLGPPDKATEQWEKLGNAPKGNWKHKIYVSGPKHIRLAYPSLLMLFEYR